LSTDAPWPLLAAVDAINDRVEGLSAGGDDYLVKRFAFAELAAHINALGRLPHWRKRPPLYVSDSEIDLLRRIGNDALSLQELSEFLIGAFGRCAGTMLAQFFEHGNEYGCAAPCRVHQWCERADHGR
jgi:hypothetical protein